MKKFFIVILFVIIGSFISSGQIIDSAARYRYVAPTFQYAMDSLIHLAQIANPMDSSEGSDANALIRQKEFMGGRISNDVSVGSDMFAPLGIAMSSFVSSSFPHCTGSISQMWKCIGPFNSYYGATSASEYQGRVNSIWVDPTDSNTILLGSDAGGLWKSVNDGLSWNNITDDALIIGSGIAGILGVNQIAVNPLDKNRIHIAIGVKSQYGKSGGYCLGLAYTTDGGLHWQTDNDFNSLVGGGYTDDVKLGYTPGTQKLYAIYRNQVLYKPDTASAWSDITPSGISGIDWFTDLKFSKVTGLPIISTNANFHTSSLWQYDPAGAGSWTQMTMTLPSPYVLWDWRDGGPPYNDGVRQISMDGDDSAYIYFVAHNSTTSAQALLLIKTSISTFTPRIRTTSFMGGCQEFEVSAANSDIIYIANYDGYNNRSMYKSADGGQTFSNFPTNGHADGRCLYVYNTSSSAINDVVYLGNDGGIRKKRKGHNYMQSITGYGLAITEFYGLGNTEADENIIVSGAHDNGANSYMKNRTPQWTHDFGWDGANSKMMHDNIQHAIGGRNNSPRSPNWLYEWTFSGTSSTVTDFGPSSSPNENSALNRPLYFDHNDTAFVGYLHIWQKAPGISGWSTPYVTEPKNSAPQALSDFYINEHHNDTVYEAYGLLAGTDPTASFAAGKLYFSSNAKTGSPAAWTNITPRIVQYDQINSIAVDPQNSARIWVALGNVNTSDITLSPSSMVNRVYYSPNSGINWIEISKGLSALPVNKLLYRRGSDDEVYAGTEVGVFKWNKYDSSWECYNTGMPPCIVTDLEINYCAGKLRASTYGRGIWEVELGKIIPIADRNRTLISGAKIWNQDRYLENSVQVLSGNTLTISNCTIHMPKGGTIIVEPGAQLIVDHATITNSCENCLWKGIEARGNTGMPQIPANQGWVVIKNGSVIEHADTALANCNTRTDLFFGTTGGIIQAKDSYFRNNHNSATFMVYDNWNSTGDTLRPNRSYFYGCTFELDNNYKGGDISYPMKSHVLMCGVEGITFRGCKFLNRDTNPIIKGRGIGIHSIKSGFNLWSYCPTSPCMYPQRSRFCGLGEGIFVQSIADYGPAVSIDYADFDSVSIGVNVLTANNVATTRCGFRVGYGAGGAYVPAGWSCYQNIGILTQNTNLFRIDENNFKGNQVHGTDWYNYGTVAVNTGEQWKSIYRCTYDSLDHGIYTIGKNHFSDRGDWTTWNGLLVQCNTFLADDTDIAVSRGTGLFEQGIYPFQPPTSGHAAGNTFTGGTADVVNRADNVSYWFYISGPSRENPYPATPTTKWSFGSAAIKTCPTHFDGLPEIIGLGPIDETVMTGRKATYRSLKATYTGSSALFKALMDYGNTDSVLHIVDTCATNARLYGILSGAQPYLSSKVLRAAADATALTPGMMKNILMQNPDNLKEPGFFNYIQDIYNFSGSDSTAIMSVAGTTTARTTLLATITTASVEMGEEANTIIMGLKSANNPAVSIYDTTGAGICTDSNNVYYLIDSNSYYAGHDSIDTWLQNIGGLWTKYERVGFYNAMGETTIADSIFQGIGAGIQATDDIDAHATYATLWGVIKNAADNGRNMYQLDADDIAALDTTSVPVESYDRAMVAMRGIPAVYGGPSGVVTTGCIYPLYEGLRKRNNEDEQTKGNAPRRQPILEINEDIGRDVKVYPNPSDGIVTFAYNVPDGNNTIRIIVTNIIGEKVMEQRPGNNTGKLFWNPKLPAGVYTYQASDDKGIIGQGKLVLTR